MPEGRIDAAFLARGVAPAGGPTNEAVPSGGATLMDTSAPAESPLRALIYQSCRSAMSSGGKAAAPSWVLEFEPRSPSLPDPLMGWSSSADTLGKVRLKFPSSKAAIAYARQRRIVATVIKPHRPKLIIRSYASNFIGKGAVGVSGRVSQPDDG